MTFPYIRLLYILVCTGCPISSDSVQGVYIQVPPMCVPCSYTVKDIQPENLLQYRAAPIPDTPAPIIAILNGGLLSVWKIDTLK